MAVTKFSDALLAVFAECTLDGQTIAPPSRQLDASLYAEFKKWMTKNFGKWKTNKQHFVFDYDPARMLERLRDGDPADFKKEWHWFATPPAVIEQMCDIHIPAYPETILEPSAGRGELVQGVNDFIQQDHEWTLIEPNPVNRAALQRKGFGELLVWDDFDTYEPPEEGFSLSYANPPFFKIMEHVAKIARCLAVGGCMCVVVPASFDRYDESARGKSKAIRRLILDLDAAFESGAQLYDTRGDFKSSGTSVRTKILYCSYKRAGVGSLLEL